MSSVLDLGGSPRQEKPAKIPRTGGGGSEICQSGDRAGDAFKGREHAYMCTLNNTEFGGGPGRGHKQVEINDLAIHPPISHAKKTGSYNCNHP